MSMAWNGRLFRPMTEWNHPIDIVWDGQLWEIELWGIVKGTRHRETALDFVRFATDTRRLADSAQFISYGPVCKSSNALVSEQVRPHLPTTSENILNALRYDSVWWSEHLEDLRVRLADWLAAGEGATERARL